MYTPTIQPFPLFIAPLPAKRKTVIVQHFNPLEFTPDDFMRFCRKFGLKESQTAQSVQDVYADLFQDEIINY